MDALGDRCEGNGKHILQIGEGMGRKGERLRERAKHEIHVGKISQWTREMT